MMGIKHDGRRPRRADGTLLFAVLALTWWIAIFGAAMSLIA